MKCFHILLSMILLSGPLAHEATSQVRVRKSAGDKTFLDMSGLTVSATPSARTFEKTLRGDLKNSGWFEMAGKGRGEFRLLGSVQEQGNSLEVECQVYGTADRRARLSKTYKADARKTRQLAHQVADDIVYALTGKKGIASTRLVLVGTASGAKELYLCDADGGNMKQLTRDGKVSIAPKWGPRGERIVYTSYLKRFPDVFLIDVASGRRSTVASYPGLNTGADISPDGKYVALILSKDGNPELYVRELAGGRPVQLTQTPRATEASPSWSPDGQQIVYVSDQSGRPQLYTISRRGGAPRRLTRRGTENVAPDWGPNGLIAYSSRLGGNYQVCVIDPKTQEIKQLKQDYADYEDPTWAPDGRHIACTRTQGYRSNVYVLDMGGDAPVALTRNKGDWYSPAWSPQ